MKATKILTIALMALPLVISSCGSKKKVIDEKMAEVKRLMPAGSLSPVDKANRCVEILQIVEDYQPAIDVLISSRPALNTLNEKDFVMLHSATAFCLQELTTGWIGSSVIIDLSSSQPVKMGRVGVP